MTNLRADVLRYDAIPDALFSRDRLILEVGARHGEAQLASRHREALLSASAEGRYCGIDIIDSECDQLKMLKGDFLTLTDDELGGPYDTIIMCEVAEHICIREWQRLFTRSKGLLKEGGVLVMTTPYRESMEKLWMYRLHDEPFGGHVVYEITPTLIRHFLPGLEWKRLRLRYPFRERGEGVTRPVGRFLKRIVKRDRLAWKWLQYEVDALMVIWTKEAVP